MVWTIEYTSTARKQLKKLDRQTAQRIVDYLDAVGELDSPHQRGHGTVENLSGLWRYRIGDYRAVCEVQGGRLVVLVLVIGHRSRIYD